MEIPYFKRWEYLPYDPACWHRQIEHTTHPVRRIICDIVSQNSNSVLDVGCGTCTDYLFFKDTPVVYHGVDVTRKYARVAHATYMVPSVSVASALQLPFTDNSFDTVYCKDLLEHLPPEAWKSVVTEMFRVATNQVLLVLFRTPTKGEPELKQGEAIGFYSRDHDRVVEFGFWYNRYNETEIFELLHALGAEHIEVLRGIKNLVHTRSNTQTIFIAKLSD